MNERQDTPHDGAHAGHLYAAQAAADFLGIHRSTLHLAVRRMKLTPDAYTPGGHARFRRETLERFSDRLALDSATGGDGGIARALSNAVTSLSHFTALEPVCEAVVDAALMACPAFEGCMVVSYNDDDDCHRGSLHLLASRGVPKQLATEYQWLRRHPGVEFISSNVARQGTRFLCGDVLEEGLAAPEGSKKALIAAGWRSCATLPCVSDGQTLGLLVCLGRMPCDFSEPELVALGNLADIVTVALRRWRRDEAARRLTETMGALIREERSTYGGSIDRGELGELRRICQQGARAKVVGEWGFDASTDAQVAPPLADLLRTAASQATPQRAEWAEEDGAYVALASPAPTPERRAAVGAIWRKQDLRSGVELALLQVYAQTCSEVASRPVRGGIRRPQAQAQ